MFLRKGVLKICSKFTGEHPCRSLISDHTSAWVFSCTFLHIFRTTFLKNTSGGCFWGLNVRWVWQIRISVAGLEILNQIRIHIIFLIWKLSAVLKKNAQLYIVLSQVLNKSIFSTALSFMFTAVWFKEFVNLSVSLRSKVPKDHSKS